ncbi:MAG: glycine zipper protein [Chitinophagaceae bacterium]|nr:glycine zipper protein [Chitinophagaceae bacterium]
MKKIIPILSIVVIAAAACNSKPSNNAGKPGEEISFKVSDTSGLSEFKNWKAKQNATAEYQREFSTAQVPQTQPQIIYVQQPAAPVVHHTSAPARRSSSRSVAHHTSSRSSSGSGNSSVYQSGSATTAPVYAPIPQKKGWSKAAKGAAIGGGAGAVIGAVVSKHNRVLGGAIGAILGGGGGYVLGRSADKKDGRY